MSTAGTTFKNLTNEQREHIIVMLEAGLKQSQIASILNIGDTTVSNVYLANKNAKEGNFKALEKMMVNGRLPGLVEWALARNGKKMPEEEKKEESKDAPKQETSEKIGLAQIKGVVTEAIAENCKSAKIEQIDKDQISRIMYALGKIDEHLESIEEHLEAIQKEQNANEDNLYKLICAFNNTVVMEMRKRR